MSRTKPTYITGARVILNKIKRFQGIEEDQELAALFPVSRGTISNWFRDDQIPMRYERVVDQLQTEKVTPDAGSRRIPTDDDRDREDHYGELERVTRDPDLVYVPMVNAEASAGPGRFSPENMIIVKWLAFGKEWLGREISKHNAIAMKVRDDSMEPWIRDGDTILIDAGSTDEKRNEVFVIDTEDGLKVKELTKHGKQWRAVSWNPNADPEKKPTFDVHFKRDGGSHEIVGRVFWCASEIQTIWKARVGAAEAWRGGKV